MLGLHFLNALLYIALIVMNAFFGLLSFMTGGLAWPVSLAAIGVVVLSWLSIARIRREHY